MYEMNKCMEIVYCLVCQKRSEQNIMRIIKMVRLGSAVVWSLKLTVTGHS